MTQGYGIGLSEILLALVGALIYFAPALCARYRKHRNITPILLLNLFGGWLFVPWLVALVWAFRVPE